MIAALIVGVPLVLLVMHRIGDLVPAMIILGGGAFAVFVLPGFPASPVACLNTPRGCTGTQLDWVAGLAIVAPIALGVIYKELRGDKRGVTGRRLP